MVGKPSLKYIYEEAKRIENDPCNPGSSKRITYKTLFEANGNYGFCHGCGAEIQAGVGYCRYCGRWYSKQ